MAIKQPALIAARDNRKKKKEKELLKPTTAKTTVSKPKTITVKSNDKGKTYVDRSTISKKPTVQNTTQNRIVTNKDRLTSKSNFGGINNDIRTVKTTKKSKPKQNYSVGTYDIYKRDGRYYYNDGKEKEIDKNFVEKAIKEKKTGVIGNYNSKGQLRRTDSSGNVKEQSLLDKASYLGRTAKARAKKGTIAIADAVLQETQNDLKKGENLKTVGDKVAKFASAIFNSNPEQGIRTAVSKAIANSGRIWKDEDKNILQKYVGTVLEGSQAIGTGQMQGLKDIRELAGSYDKNLDEKVAKVQKKLDTPVNKELEQLEQEKYNYGKGMRRAADIVGTTANMAPGIATSLITRNPELGILPMMLSAKGQTTERALQQGADLDTAIKMGTTSGLIEGGTEQLSGLGLGIFGKGTIDDIISNAINSKIRNKGINFIAKQGFGLAGEINEELISDLAGLMIDKGTIDPNAKYTFEDFLETVKNTFGSTILMNLLTGGYGSRAYNSNINDMNNFNIQQQQANEINQRVETGEIDDIEGLALLDQVKDGTYQKNRNLEQIATQESQRLKQAAQQGIISQEQYTQGLQTLTNAVNQTREEINAPQQQETTNNQQESAQESTFNNETKVKQVENKSDLKEVVDEDLYNVDIKDVENQIYRENYKLNEDVEDEDGPIGNYWDIDDTYFNLKDGNTLWIETPTEYGKLKNGKTNYNDEIHNKIKIFIEDTNGNIIEEKTLNNKKGEFTREDIINEIKNLTYDDSNKQPEGQIDMFGNVHVGKISNNVETNQNENIPATKSENVISEEVKPQKQETTNENVNQESKTEQVETQQQEKQAPEILDKMPVEKNTTIKSLKKGLDKFRQEITDRFAPVYDMARKMKNPTLYHEADAILKSDAMAQVDLGMNQVNLKGKPYKNFTDENGNKVSMSYEKAYDLYNEIPVKAKNEYLVHWLNVDRLNQGVDQFGIPLQDSLQKIQELENEYENMGKWSENIYQFYRNLTQNMVDNGRISQELADKWLKETPHFVHIERQVPNKGNQGVSVRNGKVDSDNLIRKVKGGNYPILPIKESTARYVQNSRRAFAYNQFGKEYARTIGYDAQGNNVSESTDIDEIFGFDPEFVNNDGKGNYTMKIYDKGVPVEIPISEDVYNSLSPKTIPRVGVLAEATNLYKDLLTNKNPFFGFLRNPIRDAGDMFLYSKHPLRKSLATYGKLFAGRTALKNRIMTKDGVTAQDIVDFYNNTGNGAHSFYRNGQFESQKGGIRKGIDKALSPIEKGNDFMESMPRITEFWNTIQAEGYTIKDGELVPQQGKNPKKTADQVLAEASFYAADVTVNFKRGGRTSKAISQNGGIFFNPSVQGASKFTRNITEAVGDAKAGDFQAAKRLVARAAMMGVAPAILSAAMYGGDDDYEEMQDYQKDQYYLIRKGNGKWIRIPKGRAISLFESATRRTIDKSKGNKDSFKGYGQLVMNQIAPNNPLDNNIASPIFAAINNKSWSGNKIVSDSMAKRPVEEQFNEKTDELSKKLGKQLHISPMKINYVLDQYSGVLGDLILPQITPRSSNGTSNPIVSILKDNYTFDAANSNKSIGNFYDVKGKLNTKANSVNPTSEDKLKSQYMNKQSQELYALYTKKQKIQMDKSLSKKEKYEQSLEVQKDINKFAKKATENVKDIDIKENTATIGGDLYYKNKNSKSGWSQESEKTTKTRKELGLSPEKYYYYKNDESYKTPDGYTRSITSGKNAKQTIAIVDAFNFDPSDYLKYKYKLSQIHGDKDSRGRTIRYSARNKKIKYLNSLPISAVEKAYLLKQNDKYYRASDSSLKKAISNSNLSNKEKQEIYSYLKLGR